MAAWRVRVRCMCSSQRAYASAPAGVGVAVGSGLVDLCVSALLIWSAPCDRQLGVPTPYAAGTESHWPGARHVVLPIMAAPVWQSAAGAPERVRQVTRRVRNGRGRGHTRVVS